MSDYIIKQFDPEAFKREIVDELSTKIAELMAEHNGPRLVDRQQMAELAGISIASLDGLVTAGTIPSVTIGRRRLFKPGDVIDAMSKNTNGQA